MLDPSLVEGSEANRSAFERFDADARRAVVLAQAEAQQRNHGLISVDHLLLGVLGNPACRAVKGLGSLGVTAADVYDEVGQAIGGTGPKHADRVPLATQTKEVFEYTVREASALKHRHVGTEHLLMGVVRQGSGAAGPTLKRHGLDLSSLQDEFGGVAGGVSGWLHKLTSGRKRS